MLIWELRVKSWELLYSRVLFLSEKPEKNFQQNTSQLSTLNSQLFIYTLSVLEVCGWTVTNMFSALLPWDAPFPFFPIPFGFRLKDDGLPPPPVLQNSLLNAQSRKAYDPTAPGRRDCPILSNCRMNKHQDHAGRAENQRHIQLIAYGMAKQENDIKSNDQQMPGSRRGKASAHGISSFPLFHFIIALWSRLCPCTLPQYHNTDVQLSARAL